MTPTPSADPSFVVEIPKDKAKTPDTELKVKQHLVNALPKALMSDSGGSFFYGTEDGTQFWRERLFETSASVVTKSKV